MIYAFAKDLTNPAGTRFIVRILFYRSRISMDRILASEAGDLGSNPGGSAIFLSPPCFLL